MTAPALPLDVSRRRVVLGLGFGLLAVAGLYVVLPRLAGLDETWRRLTTGDPWWLAAALGFEVLSYASYMLLFRTVRATPSVQLAADVGR